MKTQKSKYQIDAIETINHIKNNYGGLDFRHDEILPYFRREKIAPVVLYNLKMANILIAKNRGVYALNKDVNLLSDNIIANKVKLSVSKINKEKKYNHQIIKQKQKTVEHLTEKIAIELSVLSVIEAQCGIPSNYLRKQLKGTEIMKDKHYEELYDYLKKTAFAG